MRNQDHRPPKGPAGNSAARQQAGVRKALDAAAKPLTETIGHAIGMIIGLLLIRIITGRRQ